MIPLQKLFLYMYLTLLCIVGNTTGTLKATKNNSDSNSMSTDENNSDDGSMDAGELAGTIAGAIGGAAVLGTGAIAAMADDGGGLGFDPTLDDRNDLIDLGSGQKKSYKKLTQEELSQAAESLKQEKEKIIGDLENKKNELSNSKLSWIQKMNLKNECNQLQQKIHGLDKQLTVVRKEEIKRSNLLNHPSDDKASVQKSVKKIKKPKKKLHVKAEEKARTKEPKVKKKKFKIFKKNTAAKKSVTRKIPKHP